MPLVTSWDSMMHSTFAHSVQTLSSPVQRLAHTCYPKSEDLSSALVFADYFASSPAFHFSYQKQPSSLVPLRVGSKKPHRNGLTSFKILDTCFLLSTVLGSIPESYLSHSPVPPTTFSVPTMSLKSRFCQPEYLVLVSQPQNKKSVTFLPQFF